MKANLKQLADFYAQNPHLRRKIKVQTRHGYYPIEWADVTAKNSEVITIKTSGGKIVSGSPDHLLFVNDQWIRIKDINANDIVETIHGNEIVTSVVKETELCDLYDLQVDTVKEFYANGIVSHNSTMLDSICFALFNKAFRKINKTQLINTVNQKESVVELEFSIAGDDFKIIRGQKPAVFEIYKNSRLINQDASSKDYQEYLEKSVLKMSYKTFTQVVVLGSGNYTPFMQLTAADRRAVIEDLLDIRIFSIMNDILKQKAKEIKNELEESKRMVILTDDRLELHKKHEQRLNSGEDGWITKQSQTLKQKKTELAGVEKKIADFRQAATQAANMKAQTETGFVNPATIDIEIAQLEQTVQNANKYIEKFATNSCPTCQQDLSEDKITALTSDIDTRRQEASRKLSEAAERRQKQAQKAQQINKLNALIGEFDSKRFVLEQSQQAIKSYIQSIEKDIADAEIRREVVDISELEKERLNAISERDSLSQKADLLDSVGTIIKDDGIKGKIIDHYLPTMNRLINRYLQAMDLFVHFDLDSSFNETIHSRFREQFSYHSFSEGQKFRINIAILLAWREIAAMRNSISTNLLILDEVFDSSLDNAGVEDFIKLLKAVGGNQTNVFVMSHKSDNLSERFDRTLRFGLRQGFSDMQEVY